MMLWGVLRQLRWVDDRLALIGSDGLMGTNYEIPFPMCFSNEDFKVIFVSQLETSNSKSIFKYTCHALSFRLRNRYMIGTCYTIHYNITA